MNRTELEARCSNYLDWLSNSTAERIRHIAAYGSDFDELINGVTKREKLVNGMNMQCEMLRASEYPSDAETVTALLYNDTDKLTEIKNNRSTVDSKYPKVSVS